MQNALKRRRKSSAVPLFLAQRAHLSATRADTSITGGPSRPTRHSLSVGDSGMIRISCAHRLAPTADSLKNAVETQFPSSPLLLYILYSFSRFVNSVLKNTHIYFKTNAALSRASARKRTKKRGKRGGGFAPNRVFQDPRSKAALIHPVARTSRSPPQKHAQRSRTPT